MDTWDRFCGGLLALAVGNAVGAMLEFKPRGSFISIIDIVGGGSLRLQPGEWADDTSMALCLATSLLECEGFNADDQMQRYGRWRDQGYLSSNDMSPMRRRNPFFHQPRMWRLPVRRKGEYSF